MLPWFVQRLEESMINRKKKKQFSHTARATVSVNYGVLNDAMASRSRSKHSK